MEKRNKLRQLPTLQNVMQGYYWRQNELQVGKSPNFKPTVFHVASLLEEAIREIWNFANLGNTMLFSGRITEKIKFSINILSSLKVQHKERHQSPSYLQKLANFEKQCNQMFAHANSSLTIPSMKKISPELISGERKLFALASCFPGLIQES